MMRSAERTKKSLSMLLLGSALAIFSLSAISLRFVADPDIPHFLHRDNSVAPSHTKSSLQLRIREPLPQPPHVHKGLQERTCFAPELLPSDLRIRKPRCRFLPETITSGMCLRSIGNVGDESRFLPVLRKLRSQKCITVLVFGGSISMGLCKPDSADPDKPHGASEAWLSRLEHVLNLRYPCIGRHLVQNHAMNNRGTDHHYQAMRRADMQETIARADLIIMEASVNDVSSAFHAQNFDKGIGVRSNMLQFWTEATIRLLRAKFPHLALLWVEVSTRDWKGQFETATGGFRAPYRSDASFDHLRVLQYYDIPQIDVVRALGAGGLPVEKEFRTECFFCDFVHLTRYGQNITASMIASSFDRILERQQIQDIAQWFQSNKQNSSELPEPLAMTVKLDNAMRSKDGTRITFDSQEHFDMHVVDTQSRNLAIGWSFATDLENKPKTAMTVSSGSCMTIQLGLSTRISLLSFELFHSYKNVGIALIQLFERCTSTKGSFVPLGAVHYLDVHWRDGVSIGVERFIDYDFSNLGHYDCAKFVRVCAEKRKGSSKLKLYSVFASPVAASYSNFKR